MTSSTHILVSATVLGCEGLSTICQKDLKTACHLQTRQMSIENPSLKGTPVFGLLCSLVRQNRKILHCPILFSNVGPKHIDVFAHLAWTTIRLVKPDLQNDPPWEIRDTKMILIWKSCNENLNCVVFSQGKETFHPRWNQDCICWLVFTLPECTAGEQTNCKPIVWIASNLVMQEMNLDCFECTKSKGTGWNLCRRCSSPPLTCKQKGWKMLFTINQNQTKWAMSHESLKCNHKHRDHGFLHEGLLILIYTIQSAGLDFETIFGREPRNVDSHLHNPAT